LCDKPLKTISKDSPCLHWLLKRCKFKKKSFSKVFKIFNYYQIAGYLRWAAHLQDSLPNVNDEKSEGKLGGTIIQSTIKWKNIEWSFHCSESDYLGRPETKHNYPHYHLQMNVDGQKFIHYNDFHIPFSESDRLMLSLINDKDSEVKHVFGPVDTQMEDAVTVDFNDLFASPDFIEGESRAIYHAQSMISDVIGEGLTLDTIQNAYAKSRKTGIAVGELLRDKLGD